MTETLSVSHGRHVLTMERHFDHPVEKVWRAITEPAELGYWFPSRVETDLKEGGAIRFIGDGPSMEGTIVEYDPPRVFAYTWGDSTLRFQLEVEDGPRGQGCRMRFAHTFDDVVSGASFAAGWTLCFANLTRRLDGEPEDRGLAPWAALHDEFVDRFGLDAGRVEQQPDGTWTVAFARQMTKPASEVWAALTGGEAPVVGGPVPAGFTADERAGTVVAAEAPHLLRFRPGDRAADDAGNDIGDRAGEVRWELGPGNGGATVRLSQVVGGGDRSQLLAAWHDRLDGLAKTLR